MRMSEEDFIFQLGQLKRTPRSGWLSIGIKGCESVAEHSFRTAAIAHMIAKGEGLPEQECRDAMLLGLMHDAHEARVGDLTKLAKKYVNGDTAPAIAGSLGPFSETVKLLETRNPKLKTIVKDADLLEMFFQAKEYLEEGNPIASEWFAPQKLRTKTAKKIYGRMKKRGSRAWLLEAVEW